MRRRDRKTGREPTIALINVVFLMLIFFLVAGTLAPPLESDLRLVRTADLAAAPPPDALVVHADGGLSFRGAVVDSAADYMALRDGGAGPVRLLPDRALPAQTLVALASDLAAAGAERVVIVTEQGVR